MKKKIQNLNRNIDYLYIHILNYIPEQMQHRQQSVIWFSNLMGSGVGLRKLISLPWLIHKDETNNYEWKHTMKILLQASIFHVVEDKKSAKLYVGQKITSKLNQASNSENLGKFQYLLSPSENPKSLTRCRWCKHPRS